MVKKLALYAALILFGGAVVTVQAEQVQLCSQGDCDSCTGNNKR